jgi:sulfite reductase (NADPH) hemoprotein beta-component
VIERLIECYLDKRDSDAERFIDVVQRIGVEPFKERVYANADKASANRSRQRALA